MTLDEPIQSNDEQPVAYDVEGHPLYMHPSQAQTSLPQTPPAVVSRPEAIVASQAVHMARPIEMEMPFVSDATKIKHDRSHQLYPMLNLTEGEYVVAVLPRHPIGLFLSFGLGLLLTTIAISAIFNYDLVIQILGLKGFAASQAIMTPIILVCILLVWLMTYVAYDVYNSSKFFLTNESIIEQTQTTLFAHVEKTIDLGSIEDISYTQTNILQSLANYGSIRLGTIGDQKSYKYTFVVDPKRQVDLLNNAVEAFKNGRPVPSE